CILVPSAFFFLRGPSHPRSTFLPYTTLFRSKQLLQQLKLPQNVWDGMIDLALYMRGNLPTLSLHQQIQLLILPHLKIQIISLLSDRKSTRLNSSHVSISYAVFCLKKKTS